MHGRVTPTDAEAQEVPAWVDSVDARSRTSAAEMVANALARAYASQASVNAYVSFSDAAGSDAKRIDAAHPTRPLQRLLGMPVGVKDNIDVRGLACTAGSDFFRDRIAESDATAVARLRLTGAIVIGKTNLHEFAYGATNDNPFYGRCRNPWNPELISGGSSGGSAAAVAIDSCAVALGSDTGGSGRIPAAFCGITGFRPSFGAVSRSGVFPTSPSLDTIAVMARDVDDVAAAFHALAGYDALDVMSEHPAPQAVIPGPRICKIGLVDTANAADVDRDIGSAVKHAADTFQSAGHEVVDLGDPGLELAFDACNTIMKCEALSVHAERLRTEPSRFGEDTRRRLELGREITGAELAAAYGHQATWVRAIETLFRDGDGYDALLLPTTPSPPLRADSLETIATTAQLARLTYPWSLARTPVLSLPCGQTRDGLPIGMQLVCARHAEQKLLGLARDFQVATTWHRMRPPREYGSSSMREAEGW
jgi:aspartyl-tRNA(Asn)/glutamyl-tRNA(Gln) amidotransferase subunit A